MSTRVFILAGATVLWLALVGAGSAVLLDYGLTPGVSGTAPAQWPRGSDLSRNRNEATLVMVVHPHCPWFARQWRQRQGGGMQALV